MSKKRIKRVYLGTTRREKNTRLTAVLITAVLLVVVVIVSAFVLAWMLDEEIITPPVEEPDTADTVTDDAAVKDETAPPEVTPEAPDAIVLSGTPYKVLDYTDAWVVMLDAGHGFDDIGTSSALLGEVNEATVNLDITLRAKEVLEAAGVTVLLTHDTNAVDGRVSVADGGEMPKKDLVLLTPEDRGVLANGQDIDLFVSIHCDSIPDKPEVGGMRMYYCNSENDTLTAVRNAGAEALTAHIADAFHAEMGEDSILPRIKALREDVAYYVIRSIAVPSVLCEVGFVTNKEDAASMLSPDWRQQAAEGIAAGILSYQTAAEEAS